MLRPLGHGSLAARKLQLGKSRGTRLERKAMTVYKLSKKAYLKIMLHAAKYPTTPVCGYLVGPKPGNSDESEESANVSAQKRSSDVDVADAVPIFHTLPTAPMLEASALLVEELYRGKKHAIIGYYHANEHATDKTLGITGTMVAERISQECPNRCALVVNAKELENPKKSGLVLLTKSNHSDSDFEERPINTLQIENSQSTFNSLTAHLQKETQAKISDFDDHLQDVSKDFRNDSLF